MTPPDSLLDRIKEGIRCPLWGKEKKCCDRQRLVVLPLFSRAKDFSLKTKQNQPHEETWVQRKEEERQQIMRHQCWKRAGEFLVTLTSQKMGKIISLLGRLRYCLHLPFCYCHFTVLLHRCDLGWVFFVCCFSFLYKARPRQRDGRINMVGEREEKRTNAAEQCQGCQQFGKSTVTFSKLSLELSLELIEVNLFSQSKEAKTWVITVPRRSCGPASAVVKPLFSFLLTSYQGPSRMEMNGSLTSPHKNSPSKELKARKKTNVSSLLGELPVHWDTLQALLTQDIPITISTALEKSKWAMTKRAQDCWTCAGSCSAFHLSLFIQVMK